MTSPLLAELEARRARLFERLAAVGDFRRGSVSENWRRCGKPSCRRCAGRGSRGHGPRWLWTKTVPGRGTVGPAAEAGRGGEGPCRAGRLPGVRGAGRADRGGERGDLRGPSRPGCRRPGPCAGGAKKGLCGQLAGRLAADAAAEVTQLAAGVAASLAGGAGIEAAELAIRAAVMELGRSVLEPLLAADAGDRGPRTGCGAGHQAEFVSYRDKTVDTVLGPVTLRRAWYHCAECGRGLAPRDAELGVAGATMSPGLARMTGRAAAAFPFTAAAKLVGELAGIRLTAERARRRAETDGRAAAARIEAGAAAIAARQVIPLPPAGPPPGMLYIAIDGTGVPMMPAETEGQAGKGEDGRARTREVKLC